MESRRPLREQPNGLTRWPPEGLASAAGNRQRDEAKENEMYGMVQQEISRQHREEIRQAVAACRLEGNLRANREGGFRLVGDTKWELERYAGLLKKCLRNLV
jgi:hypothetical protein